MLANGYTAPVMAGLAVGIAFVVLFASLFNAVSSLQRESHAELSIEGLMDRYEVGESIEFTVRAKGYDATCGFLVFKVIDLDKNGQTISNTAERGGVMLPCEHDASNKEVVWTLPGLGLDTQLVIDKIGHYKVVASFGSKTTEEYFIVDNAYQIAIENTRELDEIRSFTNYYPEAEARVYFITTCATEDCETLIRIPGVVEYWYEDDTDGEAKIALLRVIIEQKRFGNPEHFQLSCLISGSEDVQDILGSRIEQETIVEFLQEENSCPNVHSPTQ